MVISLEDIGKKYEKHWVFQHIDAAFESGHIYPIIGSNGSGKSTLLQVISGFVTANEGKIFYHHSNQNIPVEQCYKHISMATPYLDLFEEFEVEESIILHQKLKPLRYSTEEVIDEIDLSGHRNKPLSKLSSGMRQRLKLALALFSHSDVLLLDEPISNLDTHWANWFNDSLEKVSDNRVTIICSNSNKSELKLCDQPALSMSNSR